MIEILIFSAATVGTLLFSWQWMSEWTGGAAEQLSLKLYEHIKILLRISLNKSGSSWIRGFFVVSALLGAVPLLVLNGRVADSLALIAAFFSAGLPYVLLRLRLQIMRVESSREGEILVTEILENYKIQFFNMQRAIEVSAAEIEEAPNCKRLLMNLAKGIPAAGSADDIRRLLDEFRLSINTSWANILAVNMYFALTGGMQATNALHDLSEALVMARKADEYLKRENNESKLMLKYLAPICYVMTVAGGMFFFNLTWKKYLLYQFKTAAGLTWLVISALLYISGILIYVYISKGKLDI